MGWGGVGWDEVERVRWGRVGCCGWSTEEAVQDFETTLSVQYQCAQLELGQCWCSPFCSRRIPSK